MITSRLHGGERRPPRAHDDHNGVAVAPGPVLSSYDDAVARVDRCLGLMSLVAVILVFSASVSLRHLFMIHLRSAVYQRTWHNLLPTALPAPLR